MPLCERHTFTSQESQEEDDVMMMRIHSDVLVNHTELWEQIPIVLSDLCIAIQAVYLERSHESKGWRALREGPQLDAAELMWL